MFILVVYNFPCSSSTAKCSYSIHPTRVRIPCAEVVDVGKSKECVLLRNVSPSLGLSDHFPGCGILNYRSDRDWSLRVCYFGGAL